MTASLARARAPKLGLGLALPSSGSLGQDPPAPSPRGGFRPDDVRTARRERPRFLGLPPAGLAENGGSCSEAKNSEKIRQLGEYQHLGAHGVRFFDHHRPSTAAAGTNEALGLSPRVPGPSKGDPPLAEVVVGWARLPGYLERGLHRRGPCLGEGNTGGPQLG